MNYMIKGRGKNYMPPYLGPSQGYYWDFNRAWARDLAHQIIREVFNLPSSYQFR